MAPSGPDASNSCLPPKSPVLLSVPPVPTASRGERVCLDGKGGRQNKEKAVVAYPSGKVIVVRNLEGDPLLATSSALPVLVYRGHHYATTACKMSTSGAYMVSGDERGMMRVWALDQEDHLVKYECMGLTGPIRDLDWDSESKRICFGGERAPEANGADCARCLQWDTGVTTGQLAQHLKGRVASIAFKPERPFRIVTAGKDDHKLSFHKGPPFAKVPPVSGVPCEEAHTKGAVNCIRYNSKGTLAVSVSTDRSICTYEGKTLEFKSKLENVHAATIYSVAWSADDKTVMTAGGDGLCKLFSVSENGEMAELHTWKVAEHQYGKPFDKVPIGGGQLGCTFAKGVTPVSVGLNGQISILPLPGSTDEIKLLTGHYAPTAGMAVDFANGVFYTGDTDGILCKWDLKTCQPKSRLEPPEGNADLMYVVHGGAISGLTTLGDGSLLSVGWDDKMFVTDKNGKVGLTPASLGAQPSAIGSGTKVAVICTVQGLLVVNGGKLGDMMSIPYQANTVCVSKDDKTVFVGGEDCKIYIYTVDGSTLKQKHVIEGGHLKPVTCFSLSNDGKKLASGDHRDVCVFDLTDPDYKPLIGRGRWGFHVQRVTCLSWSPDDSILASGGADDSIYLWKEAKKMRRVHYPYAHRGGLTGLAFLQEAGAMKLVSVGNDSVVNLWDVAKDAQEKFA